MDPTKHNHSLIAGTLPTRAPTVPEMRPGSGMGLAVMPMVMAKRLMSWVMESMVMVDRRMWLGFEEKAACARSWPGGRDGLGCELMFELKLLKCYKDWGDCGLPLYLREPAARAPSAMRTGCFGGVPVQDRSRPRPWILALLNCASGCVWEGVDEVHNPQGLMFEIGRRLDHRVSSFAIAFRTAYQKTLKGLERASQARW